MSGKEESLSLPTPSPPPLSVAHAKALQAVFYVVGWDGGKVLFEMFSGMNGSVLRRRAPQEKMDLLEGEGGVSSLRDFSKNSQRKTPAWHSASSADRTQGGGKWQRGVGDF